MLKKLKIVQVIYALIQGGAEKFVVDLSNKLAETHEVYIITLRGDSSDLFQNQIHKSVNYINFPIDNGFNLRDIYRLNRFIDGLKPDIIHTHLQVVFYFLLRSVFNRKEVIFHTIHNDASFDGKIRYQFHLRKFFYKRGLIIPITISEESKDSYEKYYNLDNSELINNACATPSISSQFEEVRKQVNSLKSSPENLVLVHLSRFHEDQKQHSVLIKAFNKIRSKHQNAILLIIGRGYDLDEAKFLIDIAGDGVFFLGEKSNIGDYLRLSDAFCLSSRFEGLPISLLEAISLGCVPICTPVGGIRDIIQEGEIGYMSTGIDEESYYEVLSRFVNKPYKIQKETLERFFLDNYSIARCSALHEEIFLKYLK
ncbi:glycosyltransferase [Algoriphagus jejuensis]|uniref:Glycosyltransferase n=1 Tax=Algoriphagus jejuensis TaxID=419934 RepID=A0ABN1N258_9BACT